MYKTICELRATMGRNRDDESDESTSTGLFIARFRAKVTTRTESTDFVGTSTASNDIIHTLIAPYFGVNVIPSAHTVVINGVGFIVTGVVKFGKMLRITLT